MLALNKPVKGRINNGKFMKMYVMLCMLAKLIERCTDIGKVMGSNALQA